MNQGALFVTPALFRKNETEFIIGGLFAMYNQTTNLTSLAQIQNVESLRYALSETNASELAKKLNVTFNYYIENTYGDPAVSIENSVRMRRGKVLGVVGPGTTMEAIQVSSFYTLTQTPLISDFVSTDILNSDEIEDVNFGFMRVVCNETLYHFAVTETMRTFDWTLVSTVFTDSEIGRASFQSFRADANRSNITLTCTQIIAESERLNLTSYITCLSNSMAKVIYMEVTPDYAARVLFQLYVNRDLLGPRTVIFSSSLMTFDLDDFTTKNQIPISSLQGFLSIIQSPGDTSGFVNYWNGLNPQNTNYRAFNLMWQEQFKCSLAADTSIPLCSNNLTARNINETCRCSGIEKTSDLPILGYPAYVRDASFAITNTLLNIYQNCSNFTTKELCGDTFTSNAFLSAVKEANFVGQSGTVAFNGSNRIDTNYTIFQLDSSGTRKAVGLFNMTNVVIDYSALKFNTEGIPVSKIIPDTVIVTEDIVAQIMGVIFVIGILCCIALSIYFFYHRKEKIIKKTSPLFGQLMLLGIIFVFISQIIWAFQPSRLSCILKVWFAAVGFGLIMGNLLAKTYRIFKVFNNIQVTSLVIRDLDLLKFSGAIVGIEVLLLVIYTFFLGTVDAYLTSSTTVTLYEYFSCQVPDDQTQNIMLGIFIGVNTFLVLMGAVIAYLTRNVDSAFNESQQIATTMYVYFACGVIFIPIYFFIGDGRDSVSAKFLLRSVGVAIAMYATLIVLFFPKVKTLVKYKKELTKTSTSNSREGGGGSSGRITEITGSGSVEFLSQQEY